MTPWLVCSLPIVALSCCCHLPVACNLPWTAHCGCRPHPWFCCPMPIALLLPCQQQLYLSQPLCPCYIFFVHWFHLGYTCPHTHTPPPFVPLHLFTSHRLLLWLYHTHIAFTPHISYHTHTGSGPTHIYSNYWFMPIPLMTVTLPRFTHCAMPPIPFATVLGSTFAHTSTRPLPAAPHIVADFVPHPTYLAPCPVVLWITCTHPIA